MGHTVDIDEDAAREVAEYFTALAEAEGLPMGKPMHFDAAYLRHQLPGGMVGTMRRHLTDHGVPHLMGKVIEEMGQVREELGWPIVMTPFAQMLQTQAVLNVTGKERYAVIPDEIIRYALGRFGRPNVPIEAEVMDKIMANPRTKELQAEPGMAELSELRRTDRREPVGRGIPPARDDAGRDGRRDEAPRARAARVRLPSNLLRELNGRLAARLR